ncbi:MAG: putative metal-binding motif-containing protein [Deltaproteobacteria bacterium]|nr:putative metal-binding motif-containing protein [Deltaproteobacteria bacterium]
MCHLSTGYLSVRRAMALAAAAALLATAGCLDTEFVPEDAGVAPLPSDANPAADVAAEVTATDAAADTAQPDGATDTADAAQDLDVAEDAQADATVDADTPDVIDDALQETAAGDVDAATLLPLGHTCTADAQCESKECVTVTGSPNVCSKPCTGDCPAGMRCGLDIATKSITVPYCLPLPDDLCKPCEVDDDCKAKTCVPLTETKESLCGVACAAGGVCPIGFVCQQFKSGDVCVPQLGTCTCSAAQLGNAWSCQTSTPVGKCLGSQICTDGGWSACSAPLPIPELCDGQDNDCNGQTDESYTALGTSCGLGACAGGKLVCADSKKAVICSSEKKKPTKDICNNGLDDNCDGKTDEGCPPKDSDKDGTPDLLDCGPYLSEVHPGAAEPCCAAMPLSGQPTLVATDAKTKGCDLNCDGKVAACAAADLDMDGFLAPDDCNDKEPSINPKGKDKCGDGIDQDCKDGDAVCTPQNDQDNDGWPEPVDCEDSTEKISPGAKELCNAIDDDCDGVTDDGNPGGGGPCGATGGACKAGTLVCTVVESKKVVACVDAVAGDAETCNSIDDNCDGKTDENFAELGLGTACDTDDSDFCANGIKSCQSDGLSLTCASEKVYDVLESCKAPGQGNSVDEDCDGLTDETCYASDIDGDGSVAPQDCNPADSGYSPKVSKEPCCDPGLGSGPDAVAKCDKNCDGQITSCDPADKDFDGFVADDCNPQDPASYPGAPEKCGDGIDQDCKDGDIDCGAINDEDGDGYDNEVDCKKFDKDVFPGNPEVCNGKDDDCNGAVDDGNPGGGAACGSNVGACQPGVTVCTKVNFQAQVLCVPKKGPQPELCNGLDDNCNGKTDELYFNLGKACDGGDADGCANGTWTCSADFKKEECTNESVTDLYELCNGLDDDCDGKTDEDLAYLGKAVGADCDGFGQCGPGKVVCSPELQVPVCSTDYFGTTPESKAETCNKIDDDCDGQTDEDQTFGGKKLGEACVGAGTCSTATGKVECAASGKAICSVMQGGTAFAGKLEACDGIDNDCDGHIDEGLKIQDSTCKKAGVCNETNVIAKCTAGAWDCSYNGVVGYQADKEYSCDALDNDCDGKTDEDFEIGLPCDGTDSDKCQNGTWQCSDDKGGKVCTNESKTDIVESCNGKDDDCDGESDEGFDIGVPCDGPDGDKCKNGVSICTQDGKGVTCGDEIKKDIQEACNDQDDNCDGTTDEGFTFGPDKIALGAACDGPDNDKCKNGTVLCAADGKIAVCGAETKQNIAEICNAVDDNCDGKTDEGQTYTGKSLDAGCTGTGACGVGTVVCSPVTFKATCSTNPDAFLIFNGQELCDGLDNDCNGKIDDNLSLSGVPLGGNCPAVGECGAGKVQCGTSKQVVCSTQKGGGLDQSKTEACDGKDNDCDGKTDEELTVVDSICKKVGVCGNDKLVAVCANAKWSCDYSQVPGYSEKELCDGLDNNCDGKTDEGFDIGAPCDGPDSDQCKTGSWTCKADGSDHQCINEDETDKLEVCDGKDNDCDGKTDEEFTYGPDKLALGAKCDGLGICGAGTVQCGKNLTATCSTDPDGTSPQNKTEVCNTLDDDCDGTADDGLKYGGLTVGAPCSGNGECGNGTVVCNLKQQAVCSTNPDGPDYEAKSELCNLKDDDCDGQTDEDLDPKKSTCNQLGVCATALKATCNKGSWKCSYDIAAGFEFKETLCDDVDNDCNGVTDDPYPTKGKPCDGDDVDLCKNGAFVCTDSKKDVLCLETGPGGASAEICDGKDNDCDGTTDEGYETLGQACDGPDTDLCPNGVLVCSANGQGVVCGSEFIQNLKELCDLQDNNCDGKTDEGLGLGDKCDGPDSDQCQNGTWTCGAGGKVVCENESKVGITELCNNLDDDCNGKTDETFGQKGLKCDVPTDIDDCATGSYQCTAQGALACIGDIACSGGTPCKKSGSTSQLDQCICGTQTCSVDQGDQCGGDNKCTCKGGTACVAPKKCTSTGCK